jgi:3-isopropylmalate/(R)-2-methylmalate dehydratase small subunit
LKVLAEVVTRDPQSTVTVDLLDKAVRVEASEFRLTIDESARQSLVTGNWDFLGQLVEAEEAIRSAARRLPYLNQFA